MLLCSPTAFSVAPFSCNNTICCIRSRIGVAPRPPWRWTHTRAAGAQGGFTSDQQPFDERTRRALREAAELLSEAQELAQQQARDELLASWQLGQTDSRGSAPAQPSSDTALQAFLVEQGLHKPQAELLLKALHSDEQFSVCLSTQALQQKFSSLHRVLPVLGVAALVVDEPRLLITSRCAVLDKNLRLRLLGSSKPWAQRTCCNHTAACETLLR